MLGLQARGYHRTALISAAVTGQIDLFRAV
jgi:hypothetical protein